MKKILLAVIAIILVATGYYAATINVAPQAIAMQFFSRSNVIFYPARDTHSRLGRLIPYTLAVYLLQSGQQNKQYGYVPVRRNWRGRWERGSRTICKVQDMDRAFDYYTHLVWNAYGYDRTGSHSVVCGQTYDRNIAAVEAVWQDGQMTRDEVTDSFFLISRPGSYALCELRGMSQAGEAVVRDISIVPTPAEEITGIEVSLPPCRYSTH